MGDLFKFWHMYVRNSYWTSLCWQVSSAEVNLKEHTSYMPPPSATKAAPTLALKPREDVTRSPKQGSSVAP